MTGPGPVPIEALAEDMFHLITACAGRKNLKPGDLSKEMMAKHGPACSKEDCKQALRILIDSGRCIYSYFGGTYIQLPPAPDAEQ